MPSVKSEYSFCPLEVASWTQFNGLDYVWNHWVTRVGFVVEFIVDSKNKFAVFLPDQAGVHHYLPQKSFGRHTIFDGGIVDPKDWKMDNICNNRLVKVL